MMQMRFKSFKRALLLVVTAWMALAAAPAFAQVPVSAGTDQAAMLASADTKLAANKKQDN